ncbi:ran-specific GTPase-activating protein-like [Mytilus galloprovincialis]|uniref:ran-specific GTPase-activating protein-like n=1 Tax=Mytilus galloprovincialis TaxID=29158 RepID=UPI003F7C6C98
MADDKHDDSVDESPEIHFEPVIKLPEIEVKSLEEEEEEVLKLRAKLFRFDNSFDPPEWKERGTGDCKLLKHKETGLIRVLMRRDKTLKVCANHFITAQMELKPNCGSDRAWLWSVAADYADEEAKPETLAIRFANAENAQKFNEKFNEAKTSNVKLLEKEKLGRLENGEGDNKDTDKVAEKLGEMSVKSDSSENKVDNKTDDQKTVTSEEKTDAKDQKKEEDSPKKTDSVS